MKAAPIHLCMDEIGEAATWLEASQTFLWVDINSCILHEYDTTRETFTLHQLPDMVSTIIPTQRADEVILALKGRLAIYQLKTKKLTMLVKFGADKPNFRPNDGKASPDGRIWLGLMHLSDHQDTGSLYCINPDLSVHKVLDKQSIPNGIVWNKNADKMYYADSGKGCISEYDYNAKSGEIRFTRVAVQVDPALGVPDGMTIDDNGMLWVAHWGGFGVYCWNPETGLLVDKIDVPVPNVASCTFGGKENDQLFITTARAGLSQEELDFYPLSGSLFSVNISTKKGINHYPFTTK
jgi:sugar lactone lactonase YvrE